MNNTVRQNQGQVQQHMARHITQCEELLKKHLTKQALERFGNLKIGHPQRAQQIAMLLAQGITQGQISGEIDDDTLKQVLQELIKKKNIKITRK